MRKHDVRKWLHAILDLLPVILIPVFMIYSHRHDVTENVEINYKYQSNEVNTLDDLVEGNIYHLEQMMFTGGTLNNNDTYLLSIINYTSCDYDFVFSYDDHDLQDFILFNSQFELQVIQESGDNFIYLTFESENTFFRFYVEDINEFTLYGLDFIVLDNIEVFKRQVEFFASDYPEYDFNVYRSTYNVIESVDTTNSNVMDSFMNNFNNTIQTHFNMGNVFHLEEVYQWFNTNIFGGNAPVVIQSIYNIVVYELVMDLLFLLYGLFMWFIDMIQKLMEKPLNSIK